MWEEFFCDKCSFSDKTAEITAISVQAMHQMQQWDMAARIQYCDLCHNFVHEEVHVY
jgi:hypothetical protein